MRILGGLLFLTGLATGFQALRHFLWVVWGAPPHWGALAAIVGSFLMCWGGVRGITTNSRWRSLTSAGLVLAWLFYVPALYDTIFTVTQLPPEIREGNRAELLLVFIPPALLLAASVAVVVAYTTGRRTASETR